MDIFGTASQSIEGENSDKNDKLKEMYGSEAKKMSKDIFLIDVVKAGRNSTKTNRFASFVKKPDPNALSPDKDDLESRTKAWFKAYGDWLKYTETPKNDRND